MHRDAALRTAIRRGLPRGVRVRLCRSPGRVESLLQSELVDAVVIDVRAHGVDLLSLLADRYPGIPVFAMSPFRPDDGRLLVACLEMGVRGIIVEGVDDAAAGEIISARSASSVRREALREAPRLLRLSEPLQVDAWHVVLDRVGTPTRTSDVAASLSKTREHLSREFGAGGAPNLKRVIDLVCAVWAADLLRNPGYTVGTVASILGLSSASHLAGTARRVAGVTPRILAKLGPGGVLRRFTRGRTRSRV